MAFCQRRGERAGGWAVTGAARRVGSLGKRVSHVGLQVSCVAGAVGAMAGARGDHAAHVVRDAGAGGISVVATSVVSPATEVATTMRAHYMTRRRPYTV